MIGKIFGFLLLCLVFCAPGILAETIELKNGRKIVCEILEDDGRVVVVSKDNGAFIYSFLRDEIKTIRESTPEELQKEADKKSEYASPPKKTEKKEEADPDEARLERYEAQVLAAKKARGRVKISFSKGRPGVVDAKLNGKTSAALLVDTGASLVLISKDVAKSIGIDYASLKDEITVVLANGSTAKAKPITLESVEVGSSRVKDVEAAISETPPGQEIDGLLGMSFLRYFDVKLDSKENCLYLEKY